MLFLVWQLLTIEQYVFFAVFCLLSLAWTFWFVPETSGRTLEAMDHVFKDIVSEDEEARRRGIEDQLINNARHSDDSGGKLLDGPQGREGLSS